MANVGGFLKQIYNKHKAQLSVRMREGVVKAAQNELNRIGNEHYRSIYLGSVIQTTMVNAIGVLQNYVQVNLYGWRALPSNIAANGSSAAFRYALDFTETFRLGEWGCPLKPLTMAAGMKVNLLSNHNQTEAVGVPYRLLLTVGMTQGSGNVHVCPSLQETIDPQNSIHYLRSGHFEAPSMLGIRDGGVSSQGILDYLHANCGERIPSLQEWFDQTGRYLPEVAAALRKLQQATQDLEHANGTLKELR